MWQGGRAIFDKSGAVLLKNKRLLANNRLGNLPAGFQAVIINRRSYGVLLILSISDRS